MTQKPKMITRATPLDQTFETRSSERGLLPLFFFRYLAHEAPSSDTGRAKTALPGPPQIVSGIADARPDRRNNRPVFGRMQ